MNNPEMENAIKRAEEKKRAEQEAVNRQAYAPMEQQQVIGCAMAMGTRRPSLREEAEQQVGYYRSEADKKDRAAAFFREHPEFDEFIQLIRSGVIGI